MTRSCWNRQFFDKFTFDSQTYKFSDRRKERDISVASMLGNSKESFSCVLFLFVSVTQLPACLSLCFLALMHHPRCYGDTFCSKWSNSAYDFILLHFFFSFPPFFCSFFRFFSGLLRLSGWDKVFFCCCTKEMIFDSIYRSVVINEMRMLAYIMLRMD